MYCVDGGWNVTWSQCLVGFVQLRESQVKLFTVTQYIPRGIPVVIFQDAFS